MGPVRVEHVPVIHLVVALSLVDSNLAQQGHSLVVPVQDQGVVVCDHRVITTADALHAILTYAVSMSTLLSCPEMLLLAGNGAKILPLKTLMDPMHVLCQGSTWGLCKLNALL